MKKPTIEELNKQIQALLIEIASLSSQLGIKNSFRDNQYSNIDFFEKENERIEKYLSGFTHREGVLLTIAGLFSIFPFFDIKEALSYFLIWAIPFLMVAIIAYICSSKRVNIVSMQDNNSESEPLRSREINKLLKQRYFSAMKFHKITDAALVSFFVSFIINYYLLIFVGLPNFSVSIFIIILAISLGCIRYYYVSKLKEANIPNVVVLGGIPVPTASITSTIPTTSNISSKQKIKFPDSYEIPNPYNIPIHDQKDKMNCTSHAFASMMEYNLSDHFKERTLIDVDDLWEKQKKYGTATENGGDVLEGPCKIAIKYGVKFRTDSGKTGTVFLSGLKKKEGMITTYIGKRIEMDS